MIHKCRKCGVELVVGENWLPSSKKQCDYRCRSCRAAYCDIYRSKHEEKLNVYFRERYAANREELPAKAREYHVMHRGAQNAGCRERATARRRSNGGQSMEDNKSCNSYLGIVIAERVLSMVFKNVQRMLYCNKGFDFICNNGFKVDVKSACVASGKNGWLFQINRNIIADYFVLLAFDNRQSLSPLHLWIIPGHVVNNNVSVYVAPSTLGKWLEYERPIGKVIKCCG